MISKNKDLILNLIGVVFFSFGIAAIATSLYNQNPNQIFWNCYISLLILGFGVLTRNGFLIGSQLVILAIPLLVWDIDFLYFLVMKQSLWGITDYMFLEERLLASQIISLQHLFTLPVAIYALYLIKSKSLHFWKISTIQVTLLFIAIILRTAPEENINCVFEPCLKIPLNLDYTVFWFGAIFLMIIIVNFVISYFDVFFEKSNKGEGVRRFIKKHFYDNI